MTTPIKKSSSSDDRRFHFDTRVQLGTSTVLVGGSDFVDLGVGKTTALVELVKRGAETLEKPIDELLIVYTQPQPAYMEMAAHVPVVKLFRLLDNISMKEFMDLVGDTRGPVRGIIFDDVEQSKGSGIWRIILESVTRLAHHLNAYVFFTTHLLFVEKNEFRVVQRNSAYIVLFPSVRDRSSVGILARRCFPSRPEVLTRAFDHMLREPERFPYVVLDLRPRLSDGLLRVRHSFRLDAPLVSYVSAQDAPRAPKRSKPRPPSGDGKRRPDPR